MLFEQFLLRNADKHFQRLEKDRQQNILTKELTEFQTAMQYSFNKGHQKVFLNLLSDIKNNREYDINYFKAPHSQNNFYILCMRRKLLKMFFKQFKERCQ